MIKTVTDSTFEADVLKSDKPVLVDLWAAWCAPCRAMEPTIEAVAKEYAGRITVAKLNVDENPELAQSLDVMSIPTMMMFKDGKPINRLVGLSTQARLSGAIAAALS
jgi:thioredoxin 1